MDSHGSIDDFVQVPKVVVEVPVLRDYPERFRNHLDWFRVARHVDGHDCEVELAIGESHIVPEHDVVVLSDKFSLVIRMDHPRRAVEREMISCWVQVAGVSAPPLRDA